MASGPLSITTELNVNGSWVDISGDVYNRDPMQITRGRSDEASQVDPGKCTFTLNNRDGKYSPRNPLSPYYGLLGLNTPVRVSVNAGTPHLELDGSPTGTASTPDAAALDITSDIDLRCEASIDWHAQGVNQVLLSKWDATTPNRSYALRVYNDSLHISWSNDGVANFAGSATLPYLPKRAAVRVTMAITASNVTITHYWATSIAGPWVQFNQQVNSGTTSIFAGTAPLMLGGFDPTTTPQRTPAVGTIYAAEVRNGVGGTLVAAPVTTSAGGITDSTGRVWTLNGTARLTNRITRFVGEVSAWPTRWDVSGSDVYVPVEASGILRRLGQGTSPLQSPLRREFSNPSRTSIVGYWPLEDPKDSTSLASALPDNPAATLVGGPDVAAYSDYAASDPIPTLGTGQIVANLASYAPTGSTSLRLFCNFPAAPSVETTLVTLLGTGSAASWTISRSASGGLVVRAYNTAGSEVTAWALGNVVSSQQLSVGLDLVESGGNVNWALYFVDLNLTVYRITGTLNGYDVGRVTSITLGGGDNTDVAVGHLALATDTNAYASTGYAMQAWVGESAGKRVVRIGREEDIPTFVVDPEGASALCGPQTTDTALDIMSAASDADMGVLYEQREVTGVAFRSHATLYSQQAALTVDFGALTPLEPVDDDRGVANDVEVSRDGGTSVRAVLESGRMSVLAPPDGIGRYTDSVSLNLATDDQLTDVAAWRLRMGTWDESRYPTIPVNLLAHPELTAQATAVDVGDRITVTNPPIWLAPGAIDQIAQGYTESLGLYEWLIVYNTTPAGPYSVAITDDTVLGRADTDGSQVSTAATASQTTLSVKTTAGPLWTTDAAEFPFDVVVGGEQMTVTGITGATSPQTFTVTRGVNGITKALTAGTDVRLANPAVVSF